MRERKRKNTEVTGAVLPKCHTAIPPQPSQADRGFAPCGSQLSFQANRTLAQQKRLRVVIPSEARNLLFFTSLLRWFFASGC